MSTAGEDSPAPASTLSLAESVWNEMGGDPAAPARLGLRFVGGGGLPSTFAVTDMASAAIAVAALSVGELVQALGGEVSSVTVDRRLTSMWFAWSIRPVGWAMPPARDPLTGDYRTKDGWIRIHANAPHHRAAAERVLACRNDEAAVRRRVSDWTKGELEAAIVEAGGCAAEMRSAAEWAAHPQGRAVSSEPLVRIEASEAAAPSDEAARSDEAPRSDALVSRFSWKRSPARPLAGLRVLDLTRVLAGPVATRFLAGYGAEVLRIDPPDWDEPGVVPEVTLGKRCTRLDLKSGDGRAQFEGLLAKADLLVHGYRPAALDRLGYDPARRRALAPDLIDVCLDAYGWSGPWAGRRGFDSLVQMSAGIADAGMTWKRADKPVPLPVQALDHATGYLAAAAAIRGVTRRCAVGRGLQARLSLARTAKLLLDLGRAHAQASLAPESAEDLETAVENTSWGSARRLSPPVMIEHVPMHWPLPATALGSARAEWSS
jgi:hypothetical protein